jgi:hypothetical protein
MILDLYGLTAEESRRLWATLRGVQELKVIREVLPREQREFS